MSGWDPFSKPLVDAGALRFVAPEGWTLGDRGRCRTCREPIAWATHRSTGRRAPFDAAGTSHISTCPNAEYWRQRAAAR